VPVGRDEQRAPAGRVVGRHVDEHAERGARRERVRRVASRREAARGDRDRGAEILEPGRQLGAECGVAARDDRDRVPQHGAW